MILDAHVHYVGDHPDALALLGELDLKLLNVCVAHSPCVAWRGDAELFGRLAQQYPERYAWCTTFDPPDDTALAGPVEGQHYVDRVVAGLVEDFASGAVAGKFWKNIGMEIRTPSGAFLMIDDPLFDPIYEYLASAGRPALMHIGEPLACWQPLTDANPHAGYYGAHREWYMGDKPDHPSHRDLIDARDRVLARHPRLNVIGAHLGSLEYDVTELADRLERYENFAVDLSARLPDLRLQRQENVRSLFMTYPERLLYGTDYVMRQPVSSLSEDERQAHLRGLSERYARELAYLRAGSQAPEGVRSLDLPQDVWARVVCTNAQQWYPDL
jgi:predicted TIM-barrel fold metal-dependent hydrolase